MLSRKEGFFSNNFGARGFLIRPDISAASHRLSEEQTIDTKTVYNNKERICLIHLKNPW